MVYPYPHKCTLPSQWCSGLAYSPPPSGAVSHAELIPGLLLYIQWPLLCTCSGKALNCTGLFWLKMIESQFERVRQKGKYIGPEPRMGRDITSVTGARDLFHQNSILPPFFLALWLHSLYLPTFLFQVLRRWSWSRSYPHRFPERKGSHLSQF